MAVGPEFGAAAAAARRVIDTGRTIAEGRARAVAGEPVLNETERVELMRLRSRVRDQDVRLTEQAGDVEFLKKVAAYFAKEQPK